MKDSTKRGRKGKHVKELNSPSVDPSAGFNFGYFYRSIEDHIVAYAAQAGGENTFSDIAAQLSQLLQAASVRERMGGSELVREVRQNPEADMRGRPAGLFADGDGAAPDVHVHARNARPLRRRRLSPEAIERIREAQRERWARVREKAARKKERDRKAWRRRQKRLKGPVTKSEKTKHYSDAAKGYWYNMTEEERSAEMARRRKVTADKKRKAENDE